ncbi:MAG TPA: ribonuclease J, partial [Candidatus Limnocylindrales bacterium]|nr:ribonuclease J [Candidatus Limnocylindrales bacterium]
MTNHTPATDPGDTPLRIIPLGGVGEIGKNMYVVEYGDDIVVIDCGLMFPDEEMFGIDLVVPDVTYLRERRANVKAFLITHAHEDHVGGLPYVLPNFPGVPVYASTLARGLLGIKIKEHKLTSNPLLPLDPGDELPIGPFTAIPFRVGHSIPDAMGIALRTPVGTIVHTGDFKFDHTPVDGKGSDFATIARVGAEGVICLLSDSTRAESPGYTPSERTVGEAFKEIIEPLTGRVIIATFASNIARIQQVLDAAATFDRKVAVIGRSMEQNFRIAGELGYLKYAADQIVPKDRIGDVPEGKIVIATTGSQGEPMSGLARMANRDHRFVEIESGDTVILSASPIPGNEEYV